MNNNAIIKYKKYPFFLILLFALYLSEGIFGLLPFSRIICVLYISILFITYSPHTTFSKPILMLSISMILSMISCYIFHNQSIIDSFTGYTTYTSIIIYFILLKIRIAPSIIERLLFWLFIIFCICYIYQVLVFPTPVFITENNNINESIDITIRRIRMPGMSLVGLGLFYSLNKVMLGKKIYIISIILSAIVIMLFGFRTLLFFSILFSFWMIIKINGFSKGMLVGAIVFSLIIWGFSLTNFGQETFNAMMEREENNQNFGNKDYIRYVTLFYYYEQHFQNFLEFLLGSGIPARGVISNYSAYYTRLEEMGIHYYDWGILGMSWMMGILSLIAMIWYPIKAFFSKVPIEKQYLTIWFGYLFACGFTSAEFVRQGCFLIQGIVLFLIYKYEYKKNHNSK